MTERGGYALTPLETGQTPLFTRRALVFETLTVCSVTLVPLLTVSTLVAAVPRIIPPVSLVSLVYANLQALLGLVLVSYVLYARGQTPADIGFRLRWRAILEAFVLVLVGYAVVVATALMLRGAILADVPTQRARTAFLVTSTPLSFIYVVAGPLFEETVVRAYLMTRLRTLGLSAPTVVLVSAILQTAYHTYQGPLLCARVLAALSRLRGVFRLATRRRGAGTGPRHYRHRLVGGHPFGAGAALSGGTGAADGIVRHVASILGRSRGRRAR